MTPHKEQLGGAVRWFAANGWDWGTIGLKRGLGQLDPQRLKDHLIPVANAMAPLSQIIHTVDERFGTDFSEEDRVVICHLVQTLIAALHCSYPQLLPQWLGSTRTEAIQREAEELKWALGR